MYFGLLKSEISVVSLKPILYFSKKAGDKDSPLYVNKSEGFVSIEDNFSQISMVLYMQSLVFEKKTTIRLRGAGTMKELIYSSVFS